MGKYDTERKMKIEAPSSIMHFIRDGNKTCSSTMNHMH